MSDPIDFNARLTGVSKSDGRVEWFSDDELKERTLAAQSDDYDTETLRQWVDKHHSAQIDPSVYESTVDQITYGIPASHIDADGNHVRHYPPDIFSDWGEIDDQPDFDPASTGAFSCHAIKDLDSRLWRSVKPYIIVLLVIALGVWLAYLPEFWWLS